MSVEHLEVLVEEPSMEAFLRTLLPKLQPVVSFQIYSHQGKGDLLQRLAQRLEGYAHWLPPSWRILVIVDRDDDDCTALKSTLEHLARGTGLVTRTSARGAPYAIVNRLAIEELEAWYFGDWGAVREVYPRVSPHVPRQAKYRVPDAIAGGTWEAFERILRKAGYFRTGLRKGEAARLIAAEMDPPFNRSGSFQVFRATLAEIGAS